MILCASAKLNNIITSKLAYLKTVLNEPASTVTEPKCGTETAQKFATMFATTATAVLVTEFSSRIMQR